MTFCMYCEGFDPANPFHARPRLTKRDIPDSAPRDE